MCGFFIEYKKKFFSNHLENFNLSSRLIKHRGDQAVNSYVDSNIRINFYRLKIIDLSKNGNQPMLDYSNRYIIAFNGEIYNAKELKKLIPEIKFKGNSDTELLINIYAKFKNKVLDLIEGMFSFVIYDKKKKECFIARDRFGIKPLYYYHDENSVIISSEIKPIIKYKQINNFNNKAFYDFLLKGLMDHGQSTFFEKIIALEPSNFIQLNQNKLIKKKYWDLTLPLFNNKNNQEEELQQLLTYSVKQHLVSDKKIGFFLSGGTDSSALVSICTKYFNYFPKTYTYDFIKNKFSESTKAKTIAKKLKLKNHLSILESKDVEKNFLKLVNTLESPFTSIRLFGVDKIYNAAKQDGLKVICEGHGGDEMMGGYGYNLLAYQYDLIKNSEKCSNQFKKNIDNLKKFLMNQGEYTTDGTVFSNKYFFNPDFIKKYKNIFLFKKNKNLTNLQQSQYNDLMFVKLPRVLKYTDRISMSHGIETRVPLLNHKLFNFCFHLKNDLKFRSNKSRYLFKKVLKNMGALHNFEQNKQDVVDPQKGWLGKELKSFVFDNLNSLDFQNSDFFNRKYIINYYDLFLKKEQKSSFLLFITLSSLMFIKNFREKL